MLQDALNKILLIVIAFDIFTIGVLLVFLVNFRINLHRRIAERTFVIHLVAAIQKSETTEQVARSLNLTVPEISLYCQARGIELPEARISRIETQEHQKEEETRRIIEEEAAWRAEQDRIAEDRQREKDMEMKKRKERLRKFGIA